jgi:hypothetical protein
MGLSRKRFGGGPVRERERESVRERERERERERGCRIVFV